MADDTTPTPESKKRTSPHDFDQRIESNLCLGETILNAANSPLYQPIILSAGITAGALTALGANITACRSDSSKAVIATNDVGSLVRAEHAARTELSNSIAEVRKAAKDKFPEGDPARKKYFVGLKVEKTEYQDLVQWLDELAAQLAIDPLSDKGIAPEKLTEISDATAAWKAAAKAVTDMEDEASKLRTSRDNLHKAVNATRHAIQSAADRKYPHTDPANAAARAKFKLPEDREFGG